MSNSKLLNYISHLMSNDEALEKYLADPITYAERDHGLTKAERSVLRRVVTHLSNNALNGYSIKRDLGSYRRSLRLLQNVLHNTAAKEAQGIAPQGAAPEATQLAAGQIRVTLLVYLPLAMNYNGMVSGSIIDFSCKSNADIKNAYYSLCVASFDLPAGSTVKDVLDGTHSVYIAETYQTVPFSYAFATNSENHDPYINSVTIGAQFNFTNDYGTTTVSNPTIQATLIESNGSVNPCYQLGQTPPNDNAFWFYSLNGRANPNTSGSLGTSYAKEPVNNNDVIMLQLIAPDHQYGFQSCETGHNNAFAEAKKAAASS